MASNTGKTDKEFDEESKKLGEQWAANLNEQEDNSGLTDEDVADLWQEFEAEEAAEEAKKKKG